MIEPTVKSADAAVPSVKKEEGWWETVKVIIEALLIALVVRTVLFQPFNIPSGSLVPTLLVGDYLFVSKYAYGYSHFSLPSFLDLDPSAMPGRIFASDPKRGDIIVFKLPSDGQTDYIKRLIGLPGDKIQVTHGRLIINGEMSSASRSSPFSPSITSISRWRPRNTWKLFQAGFSTGSSRSMATTEPSTIRRSMKCPPATIS